MNDAPKESLASAQFSVSVGTEVHQHAEIKVSATSGLHADFKLLFIAGKPPKASEKKLEDQLRATNKQTGWLLFINWSC